MHSESRSVEKGDNTQCINYAHDAVQIEIVAHMYFNSMYHFSKTLYTAKLLSRTPDPLGGSCTILEMYQKFMCPQSTHDPTLSLREFSEEHDQNTCFQFLP